MVDFTVKTAEEIRDDILRTYEAGLLRIGVPNPNVGPGSDLYILAQAIGNQLEVAMANCQVQADNLLPDTATDEAISRWLDIYGLSLREAAGARGSVIFETTATTYVSLYTELVDDIGLRYRVTVAGYYSDNSSIPIEAIDTGADTNHESGDVLRWVSPPPFASQTVTVATGDLTGGVDEETQATAYERLRTFLRNPPSSGNASHVATWAEESSSLVQKAFVYPTTFGPGSNFVSVAGYATDVSKSRQVDGLIVTNTVKPYIEGKGAAPVDVVVSSAVDVPFNLSMALTLPSSPKASPPGPGGGWTDGSPWPQLISKTYVSVLASPTPTSTQFAVDAETLPIEGVTQICWLSPTDWKTYQATVTKVTGTAGNCVITIDQAFSGITAGHTISPNAVNAETYFDAIVEHFASLGPGEIFSSTHPRFGRAFRHPPPSQGWPYRVDAQLLKAVVSSSDEVMDASYLYRTSSAGPSAVAGVPTIYVPNNIAFYELTS